MATASAEYQKSPRWDSTQGLEIVLKEISARRSVSKEFFGRPELFRDHATREKLVKEGWIDRGNNAVNSDPRRL
jgi:hypothetical protein